MFERFTTELRTAATQAQAIARDDGAAAVEAAHLLLALVRGPGPALAPTLAHLGLTEAAVRGALDRERTGALALVGMAAPDRRAPARSARSNPRWAPSAKLALVRTLEVAVVRGERRLEPRHLLLALAQAEAGVLPRVLVELGLTPEAITAALEGSWGGPSSNSR